MLACSFTCTVHDPNASSTIFITLLCSEKCIGTHGQYVSGSTQYSDTCMNQQQKSHHDLLIYVLLLYQHYVKLFTVLYDVSYVK